MGGGGSKLDKVLGASQADEKYFGLENFGNTCYCNSVLQALYFCEPFRENVLQYYHKHKTKEGAKLLSALGELFHTIVEQKRRTGSLAPRSFIATLRAENELFNSYMHQDAHEFMNYLLNDIDESIRKEMTNASSASPTSSTSISPRSTDAATSQDSPSVEGDGEKRTFVGEIFGGILVNETRCLMCESVTWRDEQFLDLSLDVEENCSVTNCLRQFSSTEMLNQKNKFFCDKCCSLQEAKKRMLIKQLPNTLVIHLKRFKYIEELQRLKKLHSRVVFPLELKLLNATEDAGADEIMYDLSSVVAHVGAGTSYGHYITLVRSGEHWILFDDDAVEVVDEDALTAMYGRCGNQGGGTQVGYVLVYTRCSNARSPKDR